MTQGTLIEVPAQYPPLRMDGTPTPCATNWEQRAMHGFVQVREGRGGAWMFYCSTFSADGKTGHFLAAGGGLIDVALSESGHFTIGGRRYGPRSYYH